MVLFVDWKYAKTLHFPALPLHLDAAWAVHFTMDGTVVWRSCMINASERIPRLATILQSAIWSPFSHSLHLSLPKMLPARMPLKSATFRKMKLKPRSQTIRM